MIHIIRSAWNANRPRLTLAFLAFFSLFLFATHVNHLNNEKGIATSKATGLSSVASSQSMWRESSFSLWPRHTWEPEPPLPSGLDSVSGLAEGSFAGAAVGEIRHVSTHPSQPVPQSQVAERQVVRVGTFEIIASDPLQTAEQLRGLAVALSGFVMNFSTSGNDRQSRSAQLTLSIPATSFDEARARVRKISGTVTRETVEARDVTRDYVDQNAALRNARAEEAQYLAILKHASAVKDVLEVSAKLNEVRARIDKWEADIRVLRNQVDMAFLTIDVTTREEAQLFGMHWRPLVEAKRSLRSATVGLTDYFDSMVALFIHIPLVIIWAFSILAIIRISWMAFRWMALFFFPGFAWLRPSPKQELRPV
jgi:hypothetical protein